MSANSNNRGYARGGYSPGYNSRGRYNNNYGRGGRGGFNGYSNWRAPGEYSPRAVSNSGANITASQAPQAPQAPQTPQAPLSNFPGQIPSSLLFPEMAAAAPVSSTGALAAEGAPAHGNAPALNAVNNTDVMGQSAGQVSDLIKPRSAFSSSSSDELHSNSSANKMPIQAPIPKRPVVAANLLDRASSSTTTTPSLASASQVPASIAPAAELTAKIETAKNETAKNETAKNETAKNETAKNETALYHSMLVSAAEKEAVKGETVEKETEKEAAKDETVKNETAKNKTRAPEHVSDKALAQLGEKTLSQLQYHGPADVPELRKAMDKIYTANRARITNLQERRNTATANITATYGIEQKFEEHVTAHYDRFARKFEESLGTQDAEAKMAFQIAASKSIQASKQNADQARIYRKEVDKLTKEVSALDAKLFRSVESSLDTMVASVRWAIDRSTEEDVGVKKDVEDKGKGVVGEHEG
jgi:hypothetical protein